MLKTSLSTGVFVALSLLTCARAQESNQTSYSSYTPRYKDTRHPLLRNAEHGHLNRVEKLVIDKRTNVNLADGPLQQTALHCATNCTDDNGHRIVRFLVEQGANINAIDRNGKTPLHYAVEHGFIQTVHFLLAHKAPINAQDNDGNTPLHLAHAINDPQYFKYFTKTKSITKSVYGNRNDDLFIIATALINHGADLTIINKQGDTPLHTAVVNTDIPLTRLLIEKKTPIDTQNNIGETALSIAAGNNLQNTALYLLEAGANIHTFRSNGFTPFLDAVFSDSLEMCKLLMLYGASPNIIISHGVTPLHIAAEQGNTRVAHWLINEVHAHCEAQTQRGTTPLHWALSANGRENMSNTLVANKASITRMLLAAGASPEAKSNAGYNAYAFAENDEFRSILAEHAAKKQPSTPKSA